MQRTFGSLFLLLLTAIPLLAQQPNILVIIGDDMGVDAIDGYGIGLRFPHTPTLDSLRTAGIQFNQAWAYPSCSPSRAAFLSGKYGIKNGVVTVPGNLDTVHTSLFKSLNQRAATPYTTALVGKWHLSRPATNLLHPHQHGADDFMGVMTGGVADYYDWTRTENNAQRQETEYVTSHLTSYAINWIAQQSQPWLLWLAHPAPHTPLHVPPSNLTTLTNPSNNRQQYRAMVEAMDTEIGRLLASLSPAQRANTLVIFIGDNGTPGNLLEEFPSGHGKGSLYEGGLRVPLIISGHGVSRPGEMDNTMVHITDLHATILEAVDPSIAQIGGVYNSLSFYPLLSGNPQNRPVRRYNYCEVGPSGMGTRDEYTIRTERYKYIHDLVNHTEEFYDLSVDSLEINDLMLSGLTPDQDSIRRTLMAEAATIRTAWSCNDFIQNGDETGIDCLDPMCTPCGNNVVSISPQDLASNPTIYPNPTSDAITIRFPQGGDTWDGALYDHTGHLAGIVNSLGEATIEMSVRHLPTGVYFLRLMSQNNPSPVVKKIVIQ